MTPYYTDDTVTLHHGDCLDVLTELPDNSIDAIVTDPPYGLEFMGREWDAPWQRGTDINADAGFTPDGMGKGFTALPSFTGSTNPKCFQCKGTRRGRRDGTALVPVCMCPGGGRFPNVRAVEMRAFQAWCQLWAVECLRVLKPGGHLLAFGGTRTYHRLTCAIEDAGFEIRDSISWLYGSGFPKSLDVSKAIDKAAGAERENLGIYATRGPSTNSMFRDADPTSTFTRGDRILTAPATDDAKRWHGWGTALKPSHEPVVVARKPLTGTVAANVQAYGTGALNIDACRVATTDTLTGSGSPPLKYGGANARPFHDDAEPRGVNQHDLGRWPPNVLLDESQATELDRQSGTLTSGLFKGHRNGDKFRTAYGEFKGDEANEVETYGDSGGASRFFPTFRYEAKAPAHERPKGEQANGAAAVGRRRCAACGKQAVNVRPSSQCQCPEPEWTDTASPQATGHPTVKPLDLMRWLVRLVTPPGGHVLDPFAGTGTTGEACIVEGFRCTLIEREATYLPLIVNRLTKPIQPDMFGGTA